MCMLWFCAVCSVVLDFLQAYGLSLARPLCPWAFPGKNTGVGYHFLLQGIFLTKGSNPHLLCLLCLNWHMDSLLLNHLGSHIYILQFSPVAQSCPTLCYPMDCSTPGFPIHTNSQSLLKLMAIESVMPSNHLTLCRPLLFLPSSFQHQGLSQ